MDGGNGVSSVQRLSDVPHEVGGGKRLLYERQAAAYTRGHRRDLLGVARHVQHPEPRHAKLQAGQQLGPATSRHDDVGHHEVDRRGVLREHPLGFGAIGRLQHAIAGIVEDPLGQMTHADLVFYQQHRLRGAFDRQTRRRFRHHGRAVAAAAWQVDVERRPTARFAVHPDVPLALLDDAVGRRQAEAGPLADLFGGEKRFEQAALGLPAHAASGIADREHHVAPSEDLLFVKRGVLQLHVPGLDRHDPAGGHRVSGVDDEIHHDLFELAAIGQHPRQIRRQRERDVNVVADQTAEHAGDVGDQLVHVERHGVQYLLAAEGEQLLGQPRGAAGGLHDLSEIGAVLVAERPVRVDHLAEADDHRQEVVEVVGDTGRQLADGVHLVRLPHLGLQRAQLRDVFDHADDVLRSSFGVAIDRGDDPGPHLAAVEPAVALLVDLVPVQRPRGHLVKPLRLSDRVFRFQQQRRRHSLQIGARIAQQIAQPLVDPQPPPVQPDVHDADGGGIEGRPIEAFALDQIGGARADLALEDLAVAVVVVAVGLEPQQIPHPNRELGTVDRLAQKLLGAGLEAAHPGVAIVERSDHDHGNVLGGGVRLDGFGQLVAVHPGHHDVEQDQVGRLALHHDERLFSAARGHQEKAFRAEHRLQQLAVVPLVVDDQHARLVVGNRRAPSHPWANRAAMVARNSW